MNKIELLRLLSHLCVAGLFVYAWQTAGTERNWKQLILPVTLAEYSQVSLPFEYKNHKNGVAGVS